LVRNPREDGGGIGFLVVNNRINVLLSGAWWRNGRDVRQCWVPAAGRYVLQ